MGLSAISRSYFALQRDPLSRSHASLFLAQPFRCRDAPPPIAVLLMSTTYFGGSNALDVHNQERQYGLGLEKLWVTQDGYFRIATTILGICVVDAWLAVKNGVSGNSPYIFMPITQFAETHASELATRPWETNANPTTSISVIPRHSCDSTVSALTEPIVSPSNSQLVFQMEPMSHLSLNAIENCTPWFRFSRSPARRELLATIAAVWAAS